VRERPDSVILVGYESREGESWPLLDEVACTLVAAGLTVAMELVVRGDRWHSRGDDEPGDGGSPMPDPSSTPAVADFVALGLAPFPGRAALASQFAPDEAVAGAVRMALRRRDRPRGAAFGLPPAAVPDPDPAELDRQVAVQRLEWLSLWRAVCDVGVEATAVDALEPVEIAELVASLRDRTLRDGLIAWLCPDALPLDVLPDDLVDQLRTCLPRQPTRGSSEESVFAGRRLLTRLQWLARAVPDPHAAGVLTVAANVAWCLGDGTIARVALDRALEHTPDYRLALLLDQLVGLGVRPPEAASRSVRRRSRAR
jgi:hypothetical protein